MLCFTASALAGAMFASSSLFDDKDPVRRIVGGNQEEELIKAKDKSIVLIMGVDKREDDVGRDRAVRVVAHLGGVAQVDDGAHAVVVEEALVARRERGEAVGTQEAMEEGLSAVGRGVSAELAHVVRTVKREAHPASFMRFHRFPSVAPRPSADCTCLLLYRNRRDEGTASLRGALRCPGVPWSVPWRTVPFVVTLSRRGQSSSWYFGATGPIVRAMLPTTARTYYSILVGLQSRPEGGIP